MVTAADLMPYPLTYAQTAWTFDSAQKGHGRTILEEALEAGLGYRGAVIGVATACQESGLRNLGGGDRDSLGLFQQRPSMGWGTEEQILNPHYAAGKFFSVMKSTCPGKFGADYLTKTQLWEVADAVQRSGYPTYYAKHERAAAELVAELVNGLDIPPKRVSVARKAADTLVAGAWEIVSFDTEFADGGAMHPADGASFIQGPAHYLVTASARISGLAEGTTIQTRFVEVNGAGAGVVQKAGPIQEHLVTSGDTFITQSRNGAYCDDGNRVQWHIQVATGTADGTLAFSDLQANYWAV